jgi:hypothetical protein
MQNQLTSTTTPSPSTEKAKGTDKGKLANKTTYATAKADIPNPISKLNENKGTDDMKARSW